VTEHLESTYNDIANVTSIVQYIQNEVILQVPTVATPLESVKSVAGPLDTYVTKLVEDTKKGGGFKRFARGLLQGPAEQMELDRLRGNLLHAKTSLILGMQASTIGFMKKQNATVINLVLVDKVDRWLQELPGNDAGGLKITQYLKMKGVKEGDGWFEPSTEDMQALFGPLAHPEVKQQLESMPRTEILDTTVSGFGALYGGYIGDGTDNPWGFVREDNRSLLIKNTKVTGVGSLYGRNIAPRTYEQSEKTKDQRITQAIQAKVYDKIATMESESPNTGQ
jgi:hypothetical protein